MFLLDIKLLYLTFVSPVGKGGVLAALQRGGESNPIAASQHPLSPVI